MAHGRRQAAVPFSFRALQTWARTAVSVVYKPLDVTGLSRLPLDRPVVLAANHGNALGDIAVLLAASPEFPRFLAAATWWKSPPARVLFRLGGVLPIHRHRDGDTRENTSAFAACNVALETGAHLAIFPEGELHAEPALLPLKTGAARIALGAAADAKLDAVVIVPVGLVYEDRGRFRSHVEVHFGEPIAMADWLDRYRVDAVDAVLSVTRALTDALTSVTVNHGSNEEARVVDRAVAHVEADGPPTNDRRRFAHRNALRRRLASSIASAGGPASVEYGALVAALEEHEADLRRLGIGDRGAISLDDIPIAERRALRSAIAALTVPATIGLVANGPTLAGAWLASSRVRHETWQATTKGVAGTFLSPIVWTAEFVLLARHVGRSRALALTTVGALAGAASLAWWDRVVRWRDVGAIEHAEPATALEAARASRRALHERVDALLATTR